MPGPRDRSLYQRSPNLLHSSAELQPIANKKFNCGTMIHATRILKVARPDNRGCVEMNASMLNEGH